MLRIAITGGIACGKSLVGAYISEEGVAVCDADELAHGLMVSGSHVFKAILDLFGPDILGNDGEIDRRRLGSRVFSNHAELTALNAVVHPWVKKAWLAWLENVRTSGGRAAAVIIPLLYEVGEGSGWNAVVCVSASEKVQLERLADRGLSFGDRRKRLGAQMLVSEKMKMADYVIVNNGTKDLLKQQVRIVIEHVMEKKKWQ